MKRGKKKGTEEGKNKETDQSDQYRQFVCTLAELLVQIT